MNDKSKAYYTELTDIVRIYLENEFEVDAMEMTSDEIKNAIKNITVIHVSDQKKLVETMNAADLVKFAKSKPLQHENDLNWNNILEFVKGSHKTHTESMTNPEPLVEKINTNNKEN